MTPGPLHHFAWTLQPLSPRSGGGVSAPLTAYDAYGNVKMDYNPGANDLSWSGLHGSLVGCGLTGTGPCVPAYPTGWLNGGVAGGPFKGFRTEPSPGTKLSVTDTVANVTSPDSVSVVVGPAALGRFCVTSQPLSPQVAGAAFSAALTASDAYGNVKTDYNPGRTTFRGRVCMGRWLAVG